MVVENLFGFIIEYSTNVLLSQMTVENWVQAITCPYGQVIA